MKIKATNETIIEVVKIEVERQNQLISLGVVEVNEINLNHIDVTQVTNFNELFLNFKFQKPLNIESWNFKEFININSFNPFSIKATHCTREFILGL